MNNNDALEKAKFQHWVELSKTAGTIMSIWADHYQCSGADGCIIDESAFESIDTKMIHRLIAHLAPESKVIGSLKNYRLLFNKNIPDGILPILEMVSHRSTFSGTCDICLGWQELKSDTKPILTSEAISKYLEFHKNSAATTQESYASLLNRFAVEYKYLPIEPEPIEKFLSQFSKDSTRYDYHKILRYFYKWCAKRLDTPNPTDKMTFPKPKKKVVPSLSEDEIKKLLDQPLTDRDRALILVLSGTGIRVGECKNLYFEDIGNDTLKVRGKTGEREVPMPPVVKEALLKLRNDHKPNDPIFFGKNNHKNTPLDIGGMQVVVRLAFKNAGITGKRASPHTLRHSFSKIFIANGGNTLTLKEILGHTNVSTTQRYVNLATNEIVEQSMKFNPLRSLSSPPKSMPQVETSMPKPDQTLENFDNNIAQW